MRMVADEETYLSRALSIPYRDVGLVNIADTRDRRPFIFVAKAHHTDATKVAADNIPIESPVRMQTRPTRLKPTAFPQRRIPPLRQQVILNRGGRRWRAHILERVHRIGADIPARVVERFHQRDFGG